MSVVTPFRKIASLLCVQRMSHKRALDLAALSIADVLHHDEHSREVAREANVVSRKYLHV
jgi:hypothetical protein